MMIRLRFFSPAVRRGPAKPISLSHVFVIIVSFVVL